MLKRIFISSMLLTLTSIALAQVPLDPVVDLILKERYGQAEKKLTEYAQMDKEPKNLDEVYYWLGKIKYINDNYSEAEKYFKKGIDDHSKSVMNYAGLARIRLKENNLSGANEMLNKAEDFDKGKVREYSFQRAEALLEGTPEMVGEAKVILYSLKEEDSEDVRPNIYLGEYYVKQGVPELAYEELQKAITKKPDYVPAYVYLAELKYEDGLESKKAEDFNKGLEYANKAIELDPNYAAAYRIRAELYLLAKRFDQAREDMQKYVSETQGDLNARVRYASFLYLAKDHDAAIKELNEIEEAGLSNNLMLRLKGFSLIELDKLDQALEVMNKYFENMKEDFTIYQDYQAMGDIYRKKGEYEKADEYYKKMILKNGDKWKLFEEFADEYEDKANERLKEARKLKQEARKQNTILQTAFNKRSEAYKEYQELRAQAGETEGEEKTELVSKVNEKAEFMKEQKAIQEGAEAKAKELLEEAEEVKKEAQPFYVPEAYYRKKHLEYVEGESYQAEYKYAKALFHIGPERFGTADEYFKKCSKLAPEQINPYNYRLQIARDLEDQDTTSMEWKMAEPSQDFIDVFGDKDVSELSKSEKRFLGVCYQIVTSKAFNPNAIEEPTPDDLNCGDALPLAEKLLGVEPESALAKSIIDFCQQR